MYRVGIDLGGTNIATGVVDENYQIIGRAVLKTNPEKGTEAMMNALEHSVYAAVDDAGLKLEDIKEIGIGAPGQIDCVNGIIVSACNLGAKNVLVAPILEQRLAKKVYIKNDADAGLIGEYVAGAGKKAEALVLLTLGTGIGSGILFHGKTYDGFNQVGVEFGHMCIDMHGEQCTCGSKGCWELYASASALVKQTKEKMYQHPESVMWQLCNNDLNLVNGRTAFDAMKQGDPVGKSVVMQYCEYLSVGIVNVITIFQPDVICIGGGVSNQGDFLLEPVRELVYANETIQKQSAKAEIRVAELKNDAGIIGAACLGMFQ